MSEEEPRVVALEMDYEEWSVEEASLYRRATCVNPAYAHGKVVEAQNADFADLLEKFGEAMGEEGWAPPPSWQPQHVLNLDPAQVLGFAWIPARRAQPDLAYEDFAVEVTVGRMIEAFSAAIFATEGEGPKEVPFDSPTDPETTSSPSKSTCSSPTDFIGRSQTPEPSASSSSPTP